MDYGSLVVRTIEWSRTNTISLLSCIRGFSFNSLFSVNQKCVLTTKLKSVWVKASAWIHYCRRWSVSNSAEVLFPQKTFTGHQVLPKQNHGADPPGALGKGDG